MDGGGGAPGVNSAISSGAAFGGKNGIGPGSIMGFFNIFENLSKAALKGEEGTQLFSGEFLGGSGSGLGGLKDTGIFSKIFDAIFAGADAKEAFALFAQESQASSSSGSANNNNSSGSSIGGGSAMAFPSTVGAAQGALNAGMVFTGDHPLGANYSPSATPGMGAGKGMGFDM